MTSGGGASGRADGGYLVMIAVLALVLIGFAALLTARVVGTLVQASVRETLGAVERATSRTSAAALDSWMAHREASVLVTGQAPNVVGASVWFDPLAGVCDWNSDTSCWRIDSVTAAAPAVAGLRGGEAQREVVEVAVTVVSGCAADGEAGCLRRGGFTRRYERAVFAYYQLHYDTNEIPPPAVHGLDGLADPPDCSRSAPPPASPALCDGAPAGSLIVFNSDDALTGPVRTTLAEVLYCGKATFSLVEVGTAEPAPLRPAVRVAATTTGAGAAACPGDPVWHGRDTALSPPTAQDLLDEGRVVYGAGLSRQQPAAPPAVDHSCASVDFDGVAVNLPCRDIGDGDVIAAPAGVDDITIDELLVDGSVTVYAPGDITLRGTVEASGTNPAGGPNVVALIAGGDILVAPSAADGAACLDSALHSITFTNVAVLAAGAVYAPQWKLPPCRSRTAPQLEISGSVSSRYLGLYALPDIVTGDTNGGWTKQFSYPVGFWLARPAWWPEFTDAEWSPVIPEGFEVLTVPAPATDPPAAGPLDAAAQAAAYTQARDCVTAAVAAAAVHDYGTVDYELVYQARAAGCRAAAGLHPDVPLGETSPNTLPDPAAAGGPRRLGRAIDRLARAVSVPVPASELIAVSPAVLPIAESGEASFEVSLTDPPTDAVTVAVSSADAAIAAVEPAELTFTVAGWDSAQTVKVTGAGRGAVSVTVTASSRDGDYEQMSASVSVTVS